MPTVEISRKELQKLAARTFDIDKELIRLKAEYAASGDELKIECQDTNRPDLWSVEGIAREIARKGDYKVSGNAGIIDARTAPKVRPFIAASVVKAVKLSDAAIKSLMAAQEKLDSTLGRSRERTSIGLYNYNMLKMPLKYTTTEPHENPFVPLEFSSMLTPAEILKMHPKGKEYGHILADESRYPIFIDAEKKVLSLPPIINSDDLGRIDEHTGDVLIEVTGTDKATVNDVLLFITLCLADRGGRIYAVKIRYKSKTETTPSLNRAKFRLGLDDINDMLGIDLNAKQAASLLKSMNHDAITSGKALNVMPQCYRTDIMHPVDLIEDIAIAYGYDKIKPKEPELPTHGRLNDIELLSDKVRDIMVGCGYLETMDFVLSNRQIQQQTMNLGDVKLIEIENPMSELFSCLRFWLMPSLLQFLSRNTNREYPQRIFEMGEVVVPAKTMPETHLKLCSLNASSNATFTDAKSALDSLMRTLDVRYMLRRKDHPSFIPGRCGEIVVGGKSIGIIGELHPKVLDNMGITVPVSGFELYINEMR